LNRVRLISFLLDRNDLESWLRSWVQLPPGPFLTALEIRYCFELIFSGWRTNSAAMPMPYPTVCPTFCPTKVEIFTRSVRHCPPQIDDPKICRTTSNFALLDQTAHEFSSYNAVGYCLGFPVCCLTHYCLTILTGKLIDDSRKSFS
jgi:hypothetical protein